MNLRWIATLSLGLALALPLAAGAQQQGQPLKTEKDQRSYALGMDLGGQLRKLSVDVDPTVFAKGLADGLGGGRRR